MSELRSTSEWNVTGVSAANTAQTITKASAANYTHYCTGISVAASGTTAAFLTQLLDGSTVLYQFYLSNTSTSAYPMDIRLDLPLHGTKGNALNLTVAAADSGITTTANMSGFSIVG